MRTTLRACSSLSLSFVLSLLCASACGQKAKNGAPQSPCTEEVKGAAPICGDNCTDRCGCKGCADGAQRVIGGATYVCLGNCYKTSSASIIDGGGGTGGSDDSGIDCTNPQCDPPAICGQCQNACDCCDTCVENETTTIGGTAYICTGGCFNPL